MLDVQNQLDDRGITIDKVGIKNLKYPIHFFDLQNKNYSSIAEISFFVSLSENLKGTHMSRFIEVLDRYRTQFRLSKVAELLFFAHNHFDSPKEVGLEMKFPFFLEKKAPVSQEPSYLDYQGSIQARLKNQKDVDILLGLSVPVMSLCPCSKEISDYGAHNQRSEIHVQIRSNPLIDLEELVILIEKTSSSELFSLLKREDEKYITEHSYRNPAFVEDIIRDLTLKLQSDIRIDWFSIEVESFESIHNHNAYAFIERNCKENKI